MQVFPVFLDLTHRPCLVVGGGTVGCDKASALVAAGADVLVVDPSASAPALALAAAESGLSVETRPFRDQDCDRRVLVFACTNDQSVNDAVARAAAACGVPCCRADSGGGDFSIGAVLRRGEVCVAVSSTGTSPGLAVEARDRIAAVVGDEYAAAARTLGALRERLRGNVASASAREVALRGSLTAELLEALRRGHDERARSLVENAYQAACSSDARSASAIATEPAQADAQGSRCTR